MLFYCYEIILNVSFFVIIKTFTGDLSGKAGVNLHHKPLKISKAGRISKNLNYKDFGFGNFSF